MALTRLYVLRHGEAQQMASTDAARQLTGFGRKQVLAQAQRFDADLSKVKSVYVSPYVRTQQTADELLGNLSQSLPSNTRFEADWLMPDTPLDSVVLQLNTIAERGPILLISHQPLVSYLISFLTDAPIWQVNMDTASLACMDVDEFAKGLAELKSITPALVHR